MKPRKGKKLRITEADYMLAQRRAARMEEIAEHGRPVSYSAFHKSKKVYDRKRLKRTGINLDDSFSFRAWESRSGGFTRLTGGNRRGGGTVSDGLAPAESVEP